MARHGWPAKRIYKYNLVHTAVVTRCIVWACRCCRSLLQRGARVDAFDRNQWTPLHFACYKDYIEIVEILVAGGCQYERVCRKCCYTGLVCGRDHHKTIAKFLIDAGADAKLHPPFPYLRDPDCMHASCTSSKILPAIVGIVTLVRSTAGDVLPSSLVIDRTNELECAMKPVKR
jgi:hypothetical protein